MIVMLSGGDLGGQKLDVNSGRGEDVQVKVEDRVYTYRILDTKDEVPQAVFVEMA